MDFDDFVKLERYEPGSSGFVSSESAKFGESEKKLEFGDCGNLEPVHGSEPDSEHDSEQYEG